MTLDKKIGRFLLLLLVFFRAKPISQNLRKMLLLAYSNFSRKGGSCQAENFVETGQIIFVRFFLFAFVLSFAHAYTYARNLFF